MSDDPEDVIQQIDDALGLYQALRQQSQFDDCSDMSHHKMMEVATRLSTTLKRFAPPGSHYLKAISDLDKGPGPTVPHIYLEKVPGLLMALRGEYEADILMPLATPLEGEVLSSGRRVTHVVSDLSAKVATTAAKPKYPELVFVIHGRQFLDPFHAYLRALGLKPLEWSQARKMVGKPNPYTWEIVDKALSEAGAIVALLTPDDEARLTPDFWSEHEEPFEKEYRLQPRQNVLFEAGVAYGRDPQRTILVRVGSHRPMSDLAGHHILQLNDSVDARKAVAEALQTAGCPVDLSGTDWIRAGVFLKNTAPGSPVPVKESASFGKNTQQYPDLLPAELTPRYFRGPRAVNPPPPTAPPTQKLKFRVTDAIAGAAPYVPTGDAFERYRAALSSPVLEIILRLRLVNREEPPMTLRNTQWKLEMTDGSDKPIATGYGQTLLDHVVFERYTAYYDPNKKKEHFDKDVITEASRVPLDANVPVEGWARFTVEGIDVFHAFGATLKISAKDDSDNVWTHTEKPGKWLAPVRFCFKSDPPG